MLHMFGTNVYLRLHSACRTAMVEARIKMLPDYIEAESNFDAEHSPLGFLRNTFFEVDWFNNDACSTGHASADEAATEAEIESGAEDASGLRTHRKLHRRLSIVFE